ncbi:MAG: purine-cytosine permease family protein [Jatrophihabitantaceae bacterium]
MSATAERDTARRTRVPDNEVGPTLADPSPRTLGFWDIVALWGNLGVSLLGPVAALFVLAPTGTRMSLFAATVAVLVGSIIGLLPVGYCALAGARSGQPAMVLLRGLFGSRLSWLPTALNILQCLGWGVFELVVIASAAQQLLPWDTRWVYVLVGGVLTTLMALRPLGVVRLLRRYAVVAVSLSMLYFLVQFAREPLPGFTHGGWTGFWVAVDAVIAVSISWVPLAADYTRHARTDRGAFSGTMAGYSITQIACYVLGLLAYSTVVHGSADSALFTAFIAVPFGWLPFAIFVLRELDESFTNVYSTVVSVQNLRPLWDRRVLAVVVGTITTLGALALHIDDYQNFLYLIGSVFIPMSAVFIVDFFLFGRARGWDVSAGAPTRWMMVLPWALGFCAYQLINPGQVDPSKPGFIDWWVHSWTGLQSWLHFTPQGWMSASVISFVVAAVATLPAGLNRRRRRESC